AAARSAPPASQTRISPNRAAAASAPAATGPADPGPSAPAPGGPQGGSSGGSVHPAGDPGARADYAARLNAILARAKRYPPAARSRRQEGRGLLWFEVDAGGRVVNAALRQSTGHDLLDAEILDLLRRAGPLPPIPPEAGRARMEFTVPVDFRLR
ncbi:MAG: energy transducer TonB, partial [Rubrimonas sp.]